MVRAISSIFVGKKSYIDMLQNDSGMIAFMVRLKGITQEVIAITANDLFPNAIQTIYKDGLFYPMTECKNKYDGYNTSIWKLYMKLYDGDSVSFDLCSGSNPCFDLCSNYTVSTKKTFIRVLQF